MFRSLLVKRQLSSSQLRWPILRTFCDAKNQSVVGSKTFETIRVNKLFYVDKTMYAEELILNYPRAVLQRPTRCGKSLFLNMFDRLADKSFANSFDELFGDLHVGKTKVRGKANSFYVLPITLPAGPKKTGVKCCHTEYHEHIMMGAKTLLRRHPHVNEQLFTPVRDYDNNLNYAGLLMEIRDIVGVDNLMVLVDEYDRAPMDAYVS